MALGHYSCFQLLTAVLITNRKRANEICCWKEQETTTTKRGASHCRQKREPIVSCPAWTLPFRSIPMTTTSTRRRRPMAVSCSATCRKYSTPWAFKRSRPATLPSGGSATRGRPRGTCCGQVSTTWPTTWTRSASGRRPTARPRTSEMGGATQTWVILVVCDQGRDGQKNLWVGREVTVKKICDTNPLEVVV